MVGLKGREKFWYLYPFRYNTGMLQTRDDSNSRAMQSIVWAKINPFGTKTSAHLQIPRRFYKICANTILLNTCVCVWSEDNIDNRIPMVENHCSFDKHDWNLFTISSWLSVMVYLSNQLVPVHSFNTLFKQQQIAVDSFINFQIYCQQPWLIGQPVG